MPGDSGSERENTPNERTGRGESPRSSSGQNFQERAALQNRFLISVPASDGPSKRKRPLDPKGEGGDSDDSARPTKKRKEDETLSQELLSLIHEVPPTEIDKSLKRLFPGLNSPHIGHADLPQASTSQRGAPSESHHEQAGPVENTQELDLSTTYLIPKDDLPGLVDEIIQCKQDNTNFSSHRFLSSIGVTDHCYTTIMIADTDQQIWRDHLNSKDYLGTDIRRNVYSTLAKKEQSALIAERRRNQKRDRKDRKKKKQK